MGGGERAFQTEETTSTNACVVISEGVGQNEKVRAYGDLCTLLRSL